jgi:hypothetical protein
MDIQYIPSHNVNMIVLITNVANLINFVNKFSNLVKRI